MAEQFVCKELASRPNIYGEYACKNWTTYNPTYSVISNLAITKSEMVDIGGSIVGVFALFVAYAILAKAVKML